MDAIKTARDLEEFLKDPVGKYMLAKADDEERQAELEFRIVDPDDAKQIREVQNRLIVVDMFRRFIIEGIESGKLAQDEQQREVSDY